MPFYRKHSHGVPQICATVSVRGLLEDDGLHTQLRRDACMTAAQFQCWHSPLGGLSAAQTASSVRCVAVVGAARQPGEGTHHGKVLELR